MSAIVWFRRDLRLTDNPAFSAAAASGKILPVFLPEEEEHGNWKTGSASRVWLQESLRKLSAALHGRLLLLAGTADETLPQLAEQSGASALFYNRRYEPAARRAETAMENRLRARLAIHAFDGNVLLPPESLATKNGGIYKVFTPFYQNGVLPLLDAQPPLPLPAPAAPVFADAPPAKALPRHPLLSQPLPAWGKKLLTHWQTGEHAAAAAAERFAAQAADYAARRDFPADREGGVSRLSPHLHFGEISPRQLWRRIDDSKHPFLRQLVWREFSTYLLYHFPTFPDRNWRQAFDAFPWREDAEALARWQRGETGFPIVDAAMRELQQTGYMHNRARMISASFLTKNLLLHWQHGARWFWDCLLDADLANNSAGWQWVAGSGADAAPYFRIFNPLLQSKKFDADGAYLCRYLPCLRALPPALRHCPWQAGGVRGYPPPMVDLAETRQRALNAEQQIHGNSK